MTLSKSLGDREHYKFKLNSLGETAVNVINDPESVGDGVDSSQLIKVSPAFYHVSAPVADTEYSQALSPNTKAVLLKATKICELKVYFSTGAPTWITIPKGGYYYRENLKLNGATIYFKSSTSSNLIEIEEWT